MGPIEEAPTKATAKKDHTLEIKRENKGEIKVALGWLGIMMDIPIYIDVNFLGWAHRGTALYLSELKCPTMEACSVNFNAHEVEEWPGDATLTNHG